MKKCVIISYGEEERLCKVCGYVMWEDKGKSDDEIIDSVIKRGYEKPKCRNNE